MTTEERAKELFRASRHPLVSRFRLDQMWFDSPQYVRDEWLRVATHVEERERKLREFGEKYGGHAQNCAAIKFWEQEMPCTCGFDAAKEGLKG